LTLRRFVVSEVKTQLWGLKILIEAVRVANQQGIYTPESVEVIKEAIGLFVQPSPPGEQVQPDTVDQSDVGEASPVEDDAADPTNVDEDTDTEE